MIKPAKFKCTEPGCTSTKEYDAAHLGIHKRAVHGILGKTRNAAKSRMQRAEADTKKWKAGAKAAKDEATPTKRTYTKRSNQLAISPEAPTQTNGHIQTNNGSSYRRFAAETAVAIGYDRFKELCKNVAIEYDLPPRGYAAALRDLINAETLR